MLIGGGLILMLLIPILLSAGTWLDRVLNSGSNGLPVDGTRSWRIMSKTMSYPSGTNWDESERMIYHYNSTITSQPIRGLNGQRDPAGMRHGPAAGLSAT